MESEPKHYWMLASDKLAGWDNYSRRCKLLKYQRVYMYVYAVTSFTDMSTQPAAGSVQHLDLVIVVCHNHAATTSSAVADIETSSYRHAHANEIHPKCKYTLCHLAIVSVYSNRKKQYTVKRMNMISSVIESAALLAKRNT